MLMELLAAARGGPTGEDPLQTVLTVGLVAVLAVSATAAEARGHHRHHRHHHHHHSLRLPFFAAPTSNRLVAVASAYVGRGKFTQMPGPWCRDAVNVWLRQAGFHTDDSRLALMALHLGPRVAPQPGALAVSKRRGGGHVAVVAAVSGNKTLIISPNDGHRVRARWVSTHRAFAYIKPI